MYQPRTYRNWSSTNTVAFSVVYEESDLFCRADRDLSVEATKALTTLRMRLDTYAKAHPAFVSSLVPLADDKQAPPVARAMFAAAQAAGVGPLAAVAGAVADAVGRELASLSETVIIENGGDCYLQFSKSLTVPILAGKNPLSGKVGMQLEPELSPCGLCTSSATVGHSLSLGKTDAVSVLAETAALADAVATATANRITAQAECAAALEWAAALPGVYGAVALVDNTLAAAGNIKLIKTNFADSAISSVATEER